MGATRDDAAGEAFDKVARILNLGYPGGPIIERVAREGRPRSIPLPSIRFKEDTFDFSFSGIKTAVLYYVMDLEKEEASIPTADLAASFQAKVAEIIAERIFRAASLKKVKRIVLGGGVSCNLFLRSFIQEEKPKDLKIFFPPPSLCTDNAAMIAACAYPKMREGLTSPPSLDVQPNLGF
ncbi:tRNA N6-adenosine threonylcarbamoyltransferase [subsurface metagenome]